MEYNSHLYREYNFFDMFKKRSYDGVETLSSLVSEAEPLEEVAFNVCG